METLFGLILARMIHKGPAPTAEMAALQDRCRALDSPFATPAPGLSVAESAALSGRVDPKRRSRACEFT